ncbi:MAG: CopG family transcriptional regulator [Chloroflexota bacterium]
MQNTITITLPSDVRDSLNKLVRKEGISADDFIYQAVREYLFIRQFRLLRERLNPKARARGVYTDQDVFDRVS